MSNLETLLTAWLQGGTIPADFKPSSNVEEYLLAILNGVDDDIDPKSRADVLLDAIATKYAGYSDGLEELRDVSGMTAHHVPGGDTPEEVAAFLRAINGTALQDLAAKGATGVSDNTTDILWAYRDLPSGGAELNIAYGSTAPEDTTKLWIKTDTPENITVDYNPDNTVETVALMATTLPAATEAFGCGSVGTKIYLFGGNTSGGNTNTIKVYDAETDTINTLSVTLPYATRGMACGVVGTKIYLFGGVNGTTQATAIHEFDTETNTLTTLTATLPSGTESSACCVVGNKCYLFGGYYNNAPKNTIFCFDAEAKTITTVPATLPIAAYNMACGVVGTKIYLFGGDAGSGGKRNTIIQFDAETSSITTLTPTLPLTLYGAACGVVGIKCYIFGGHNGSNYSNKIYEFDAATETVATLDETLSAATWCPACGVVSTRCYIFGGQIAGGKTANIDKFTVTFPLADGDVFIQEDMLRNKFDLLTSPTKVTVGVAAVSVGNSSGYAEDAEAYLHDGTSWQQI